MRKQRLAQWLDVAGVAGAMLLAVLVNVFAARHYKRWDFTTHGLYTLSQATTKASIRMVRLEPMTLKLASLARSVVD